jgi:HEAT repeat protein
MRRAGVLLLVLLVAGCAKEATPQLIEKLKASDAATRLKAVRTLPERTAEPELVVPALISALQDDDADVRRSAATGLGTFGEQAREAVPSLQACMRDREYRVRKAAGQSLKRIDPAAATKAGVR